MKKADEVLKALMNQLDIKGGEKYIRFFSSWKEIAGRDLAAHSQVSDIRNSIGIVEVDHPAWMQILQMKEKDILAKMKKRFPELGINRLHLRLVDRAEWSEPFQEEKSGESQREEPHQEKPQDTEQKQAENQKEMTEEGAKVDKDREHFKNMLERLHEDIKKRDRERE